VRQTYLGIRTNHDVFEPKVGDHRETLLCQSQHLLTAIDPVQLGIGELFMQEGEQDSCSTGHIQQTWDKEFLRGMIGDSLGIESRERF